MSRNDMPKGNRIAAFLWVFTLVWLAMLTIFTWLMLRDGPPDGMAPWIAWAVLALFWLGGAGCAAHALDQPCQFVSVDNDGVSFTWLYPHRRRRSRFRADEIGTPDLVTDKDSDGDPYFRATLRLPDGQLFILSEGHDRATCEAAIRGFETALGR